MAHDRAGLIHVERQPLRQAFDDIGHDNLVDEIGFGESLGGRRAVFTRADDGDLAHDAPCVMGGLPG